MIMMRPAVAILALATACTRPDARPADSSPPGDSVAVAVENAPPPESHLIWPVGIGPIRVGMTLGEARKALPAARFTRTSDGDGVPLVEAVLGADTTESVILVADLADADSIDWTKRIEIIETFSPAFRTEGGVRVGALISDVEKILGKTKEITLSEIESRQYIEFENQPPWISFRLDYSGQFAGESRTTKTYSPGARIHSIAVSWR